MRPARAMRRLVLAAALLGLPAVAPPGASATTWLCRPGHPGPCGGGLTATVLSPSGAVLGTEHAVADRRAPIDCFYVYPTVSDQPAPEANLGIGPAERSIALYQAARFSQVCRVWAPMYRQITLAGLLRPGTVTAAMRARAYADVRDAWRDYLARHNHGRGVVLIGHSQGSFVLRRLIAREIDGRPAVRRRLVSALLLGGNVTVARGRARGGDFRHVPACRRSTQTGCVIAYSTFDGPVPSDSLFGRATGADASRLRILCTNPASLRGGSGLLTAYVPTAPFGGTLAGALATMRGALPAVPTPWIAYRRAYRAHCSSAGGADVLQVAPVGGARALGPSPDARWGLHLADVNIALGNLTSLVGRQSRAYLRRTHRRAG